MLPLTEEENKLYKKQKICYIVRQKTINSNKRYYKVQDYYHYIGKYRGTAKNIEINFK